jgi:hypothetical protein
MGEAVPELSAGERVETVRTRVTPMLTELVNTVFERYGWPGLLAAALVALLAVSVVHSWWQERRP